MNSITTILLDNFNFDIKVMDISNQNISGILDLIKFSNLEELYCQKNKITQIINLPDKLKRINCSSNKIKRLEKIPKNISTINYKTNCLTHLYYPFNIKPIKYPRKLKYLTLGPKFEQSIDIGIKPDFETKSQPLIHSL